MYIKVLKGVVGDAGKNLQADSVEEVTDATGNYLIKKEKARKATKEEIFEHKEKIVRKLLSPEEIKKIADKKIEDDDQNSDKNQDKDKKDSGKTKASKKNDDNKTVFKKSDKKEVNKQSTKKSSSKNESSSAKDNQGIIDTADDFNEPEADDDLTGAEEELAEAVSNQNK